MVVRFSFAKVLGPPALALDMQSPPSLLPTFQYHLHDATLYEETSLSRRNVCIVFTVSLVRSGRIETFSTSDRVHARQIIKTASYPGMLLILTQRLVLDLLVPPITLRVRRHELTSDHPRTIIYQYQGL